tara:strand:+ start:115 stop:738 length:624 start_codon:yes stop_codon:yes gene_type:complete
MAHFAKIGENKKVIAVLTLDNKDVLNADGVEQEAVGQAYLEKHNNWPAQMWIQTSYNTSGNTHKLGGTPFRGNYAGIGQEWDEANNIFWHRKPYASWVKNTSTAQWQSPIGDAPAFSAEQQNQNEADTHRWIYIWNEDNQSWDLDNSLARKPYDSWVKNTNTDQWQSPIGDAPALTAEQEADAANNYNYTWNEEGQSWDLVTTPVVA